MKRRRWVAGAVAVAGVVASLAPAVGQGKADSTSLRWSGSRRSATLTRYDLGAIDGGAHVSKAFRLWNSGLSKSGKFAISLTGSSAFSIALDHCTKKSLGNRWCLVSVAYRPLGDGTSDSATLRATGGHGAAASLSLSGSSAGPSGHFYWVNYGDGTVNSVPRGGGSVTTLASGQSYPTQSRWTARTSTGSTTYPAYGTVNEVPLGGGAVTTLASGQDDPGSVAVDGTNVYWVNSEPVGTVNEVPVGGGSVTTLASGQNPRLAGGGRHERLLGQLQRGR